MISRRRSSTGRNRLDQPRRWMLRISAPSPGFRFKSPISRTSSGNEPTPPPSVELKGGSGARAVAIRTEDIESLRGQVSGLRDQLQRESLAFGELRAQAARYEAMAHNALSQAEEAEARERKYLRELGAARQRIAELEAAVNQLRERLATALKGPRPRVPATKKPKLSKKRKALLKPRRNTTLDRKRSKVRIARGERGRARRRSR